MKKNRKMLLAVLAIILVLVLIKGVTFIKGGKKDAIPSSSASVQTITTQTVSSIDKIDTLSLAGNIEANNDAAISSKSGGKISKVLVENGSQVSAGQALALLETTDLNNSLESSQATLDKAQATLDSMQVNYDRIKSLYNEGAVSKKDFDDITTSLQVAENDVRSAAAAVSSAKNAINDATITAPISGYVHDRNVIIGQVVTGGQTLMSVGDLSSVYVTVNVPQQDLSKIKQGLSADILVDAFKDEKFSGTVAVVNPSIDVSARVFQVKIKINNDKVLLKPGMFAKVEIKIGAPKKVTAVPMNSITGIQGLYFAFVVEGDKVIRKQVEIGQMIGQSIEIKSGLSVGQKIAVTNVNSLKDQDKIIISN